MRTQQTYTDFNAFTVPLQESNLIEASAGTGKTYSIAILVLRLVLEKQLSVKDILMVTFTKAAVAELEERVRLFVRNAHKCVEGKGIEDANITGLVQAAIEQRGLEVVQQQLKEAVLFLDETSVLTIHSFCQQALNEFAFETFQLFGAQMMPDLTPVIEEELNKFWRKHITTLPVGLLQQLWYEKLKEHLQKALTNHLGGRRYPGFQPGVSYAITKPLLQSWQELLTTKNEAVNVMQEKLHHYILTQQDTLRVLCEGNTHAKKGLLPCLSNPEDFIRAVREKKSTAYVIKLFPELLALIAQYDAAVEAQQTAMQGIYQHLFNLAIQEAGQGIQHFKERNNVLGYDDLIGNLHHALVEKNNAPLTVVLRRKFKAVFIDEFQDTDRQQYEIFDKAFGQDTILFYIGDPKQSIYAWRKADIFTYFKARDSVKHLYSMNHNYRSSARMIEGMNQFFLPETGFDTFYFEQADHAIDYIPVESPVPNTKGELLQAGVELPALTIYSLPKKKAILDALSAQVALLLQDDRYQIDRKGLSRRITPADIGILVRTGQQGREVKAALSRLGIPAVTIDDAKVLQSNEAVYLLYLLEAIANPERPSINRALLSPFTGFDVAQLLDLDDSVVLELFTRYKNRWQQDGIYTALMDFVADFRVRQLLVGASTENGERIITNLFQLIELVHQAESRKNLSVPELLSWLKRGIDDQSAEGDEYTQRMESDEAAVKIVTIHKSKGLEYNIVMAPFLDFVESKTQDFVSFRDPHDGDYVGTERSRLTEEQVRWHQQQAEQENRRLLYVAITRAVYTCYVFRNLYYRSSTLATFVHALGDADPSLVLFKEEAPTAPALPYRPAANKQVTAKAPPVQFVLQEESWRKMSYTMLAAQPDHPVAPRSYPLPEAYDNFMFHVLRRGAKTGNFLHFIFENIHFGDDKRWEYWLKEAIRRYVPGQEELYYPLLQELLQQVLHTPLGGEAAPFKLADVAWNKRLTEFEFDFPVPSFPPEALHRLSDDQASILIRSLHALPGHELEGMMNGKIDLFFEHGGRYYILDWKSNYLGNSLDDYSPAALARAMNDHNYHLQYLIYTVAVRKYLATRLPRFDYATQFGGVIYVFVRGVRAHTDTGIFLHKPSLEKIEALERIIG